MADITPKQITGRKKRLEQPKFCRIRFDATLLAAYKAWCWENEVPFNAFVRKATDELYKKVTGTS